MTRLLLFTNDYPYGSGDSVFVQKEIPALAERFDDVIVFCHARDTSAAMVDMPSNVVLGGNLFRPAPEDRIWTPLRPRYLGATIAAAAREARAGRLRGHVRLFLMGARVGITQAHRATVREAIAGDPQSVAYAFWGMGGGLGLAWLRGVRARAVRLHRYDLYEDRSPEGYLPFRRHLFARADRVLVISRDGQEYLAETYRDPELDGKTVLSRLGVAGPDVLTRPPRGPERVVVSCSAVSEVKRVDLILAAVSELAATTDAHVRWVHFGSGPDEDALRQQAEAAPPGLTVELRGQTPNDEVTRFYREERVDVFVNASSSEGVPVSIMEAAAFGIPVVATAVGGTPEIVGTDLGSGELVSADPLPGEIGRALRTVLEAEDGAYDPRRVWAERYDVRRTAAHAADLIRGLLPA
nr:glycosyltransferase [Microbacterium flavescens]